MPAFTFTALIFGLSLAGQAFAAPTIRSPILAVEGSIIKGSYIVKLLDTANKDSVLSTFRNQLSSEFNVVHDYDPKFFNGFSGQFEQAVLERIANSDHVEYISQDGLVHTTGSQINAPWGLQRVSHPGSLPPNSNPNNLAYRYDYPAGVGEGVYIYVVDTGINTAHVNFQGRAVFGYSALSSTEDGNGHGTHCAGTAVGSLFGVARDSRVIAVKVLSDDGSGSTSDIIAGINYVVAQYRQNGIPSIISMSLGGAPNTPLDQAVNAAINAGVHTVVAAGNNGRDASLYSPARVQNAITVGAVTVRDVRASFSNFGQVVDIWAPGQNVISSWIGSSTATKNISGTSMATPHVAGILATLISQYGNRSPAYMTQLLLQTTDRTATGLPVAQLSRSGASGNDDSDTPDDLLPSPL